MDMYKKIIQEYEKQDKERYDLLILCKPVYEVLKKELIVDEVRDAIVGLMRVVKEKDNLIEISSLFNIGKLLSGDKVLNIKKHEHSESTFSNSNIGAGLFYSLSYQKDAKFCLTLSTYLEVSYPRSFAHTVPQPFYIEWTKKPGVVSDDGIWIVPITYYDKPIPSPLMINS